MKIFYKKDYEQVKKDYINLVERCNANYIGYEKAIASLEEQLRHYEDVINKQHNEIIDLKSVRRKFNSAKGGFTAKINKLTKENEELNNKIVELEEKLKESMTDKYLVKKIKSQRTPQTQKMHLTSNAKTSSIVKKIYE